MDQRDRTYIGVIGAGGGDPAAERLAEEVGRELARRGALLVCGGLGGVMEAACRGAKSAGGTTIGILPTERRGIENPHLDIALPTGIGEMRNMLIVRASDALIAVGGEFGTLAEIAFARKVGKPVVGLDTWELAKGGRAWNAVVRASSPPDAVHQALRLAQVPPPATRPI
ncbi:MAG: TIGR00725 family protein [Actinomycetota bacterium]|nr:TIGR00725 family protein [Actinomycetota bacterium]